MRIIANVVVNAIAIWVATLIFDSVDVGGRGTSTAQKIGAYLVVGAILGLVNAFIKPVVKFFAFPFIILTLGLLTLVINAFMLEIVDWVLRKVDLGITFDSGPFFWSTIGAAVVVTLVSMVLNGLIPEKD